MGTKYTSQSITGYNASPPSDDGTQVESNKVFWSTIKTKLDDPIKDRQDNINSALVTMADLGPISKTTTYTVTTAEHLKTIECDGTFTLTLLAASGNSGFTVTIKNIGTGTITIDGNGSEEIDGDLTVVLDGQYDVLVIQVNSAADGWGIVSTNVPRVGTPSMLLLETWTATAVTTKEFTFDESVYSGIKLVLEDIIPATDNVQLLVRFGHTNGGTIISSADYSQVRTDPSSSTLTQAAAQTSIAVANAVGTDTNEGISGYMETAGFPSIRSAKGITSAMVWNNSAANPSMFQIIAFCAAAPSTAFDTVQLLWSSGDFEANGEIQVHGLLR